MLSADNEGFLRFNITKYQKARFRNISFSITQWRSNVQKALKSSKFYEAKKEQDDLMARTHAEAFRIDAEIEAANRKLQAQRDRTVFLGFFVIGLIATLVISKALKFDLSIFGL